MKDNYLYGIILQSSWNVVKTLDLVNWVEGTSGTIDISLIRQEHVWSCPLNLDFVTASAPGITKYFIGKNRNISQKMIPDINGLRSACAWR